MALRADFLSKHFELLEKGEEMEISSVSSDSRKVKSGSLFVAIRGQKQDGHQHLREAVRKGAAALLLERAAPRPSDFKGAVFKAADSRLALSMALNEFYDFPSRKIFTVGVTGTNGKTTVSYMLEQIFNSCGWPTGVIGTIDQHFHPAPSLGKTGGSGGFRRPASLTTPEPVELFKGLAEFVKRGAKALAMEVSSIGLDQKRVEGIEFRGAVFTNLTSDHLDYHLNMENYFRAKKRLFELTKSSGVLRKNPQDSLGRQSSKGGSAGLSAAASPSDILDKFPAIAQKNFFCLINKDDQYGRKILGRSGPPYYSYGKAGADFSFDMESQTLNETVFSLRGPSGSARTRLPAAGIYNVYNAAAAMACAAIAGFSLKEAAGALESFPGVPGRLQLASAPNDPFQVFVDYAHTPLALRAALQTLKGFAGGKRLITVFGCGGERDRQKRAPMVRTALEFSNHVFFTSDNPRHEDPAAIISEGLKEADKESLSRLTAIDDRREAIKKAINFAKKGDILLIAGKGHEAFQILGDKRIPFDDRETAKEFLKSLKKRG